MKKKTLMKFWNFLNQKNKQNLINERTNYMNDRDVQKKI